MSNIVCSYSQVLHVSSPQKILGLAGRGAALRSASFQPEPVLSNAEGSRNLASVSRLATQDNDIFDGKAGTFVLDLL